MTHNLNNVKKKTISQKIVSCLLKISFYKDEQSSMVIYRDRYWLHYPTFDSNFEYANKETFMMGKAQFFFFFFKYSRFVIGLNKNIR